MSDTIVSDDGAKKRRKHPSGSDAIKVYFPKSVPMERAALKALSLKAGKTQGEFLFELALPALRALMAKTWPGIPSENTAVGGERS